MNENMAPNSHHFHSVRIILKGDMGKEKLSPTDVKTELLFFITCALLLIYECVLLCGKFEFVPQNSFA
jgi:hypothetical protein